MPPAATVLTGSLRVASMWSCSTVTTVSLVKAVVAFDHKVTMASPTLHAAAARARRFCYTQGCSQRLMVLLSCQATHANMGGVAAAPVPAASLTAGDVWTDVDAARTGNLPFVFEPDMSFEKYVDYAMDVPMYFVYRKGQYINALGQSWRDFMEVSSW